MRARLLLFRDLRDWISVAVGDNGFRRLLVPDPIGAIVFVAAFLEVRPLIGPFVLALRDFEFRRDPPIIARLEITNLQFAFVNDRQRRRLHSAYGRDVAGARAEHPFSDRPRAVDADQPIALAPRSGRVREPAHLAFITQVIERFADRLRRHRLQPKPLDRVFVFREPAKIIEDELALAAGVAGIDDLRDVLARDQSFQRGEHALRFIDRLQFERFRNDRQRLQAPETIFFLVDVLRHEQFRDVTDGGRNDVLVVLVGVAFFRHLAQGAGEVRGHAGFLGDDERFRHFVVG